MWLKHSKYVFVFLACGVAHAMEENGEGAAQERPAVSFTRLGALHPRGIVARAASDQVGYEFVLRSIGQARLNSVLNNFTKAPSSFSVQIDCRIVCLRMAAADSQQGLAGLNASQEACGEAMMLRAELNAYEREIRCLRWLQYIVKPFS